MRWGIYFCVALVNLLFYEISAGKSTSEPFSPELVFDSTYEKLNLGASERLEAQLDSIHCKNLEVALDASGLASITADQIDSTKISMTGVNVVLGLSINTFDCTTTGLNIVTLTATDEANNSAMCQAVVVVEDRMGPKALCQDITVSLPAGGACSITPNQIDSGSIDNCSVSFLSVFPSYFTTAQVGDNLVSLTVTDNSGNSTSCTANVHVIEYREPKPICTSTQIIELLPVIPAADLDADGDLDNGAATLLAEDLISGLTFNCGIELTYSINRVGEPRDENQSSLILTCDDEGNTSIEVWGYDAAGNEGFCETSVTLKENIVQCSPAFGMLFGLITVENAKPVGGVTVQLSSVDSRTVETAANGRYAFENLKKEMDYTLIPQREGSPFNGVSSFDVLQLFKHILGIQLINSPYGKIAADINNDHRITTLDTIALKRLVLNIDLNFATNSTWRFVPAAYIFPDPEDPWIENFPEGIVINNLRGGAYQHDFVAIKVGDLNGSARLDLE